MSQQLPFLMQTQQASQWCWSAVSVSVDDFQAPPTQWTQCLLVNDMLARQDCCGSSPGFGCDTQNTLSAALTRVGRLSPPHHSQQLADATIIGEIDAGKPVCIRIEWQDAFHTGHFVAIIGYDDSDPANLQWKVSDPFHGLSTVDANTFPSLYKVIGASWTHTYLIA